MAALDRSVGRRAFGADPAAYAAARPDYPPFVYRTLVDRCGLGPGRAVFEIGAGAGLATRHLLELGAEPLIAIEPDPRLAAHLRAALPHPALQVRATAFEDCDLPPAAFDLGVAATAFHWLDEVAALARIGRALRPGGWWASWWNVFGDPDRADPFHEATLHLFEDQTRSPSEGAPGRPPFALDVERRTAALAASGLFEPANCELDRWTLVLDPEQARRLYATYSQITVRPPAEAERLLDAVRDIAEGAFGGRVERNMITILYTARRTAGG